MGEYQRDRERERQRQAEEVARRKREEAARRKQAEEAARRKQAEQATQKKLTDVNRQHPTNDTQRQDPSQNRPQNKFTSEADSKAKIADQTPSKGQVQRTQPNGTLSKRQDPTDPQALFRQHQQLRGDTPRTLSGTDLRNELGVAMNFMPNNVPKTPEQEKALKQGTWDYFSSEGVPPHLAKNLTPEQQKKVG